MLGFYANRIVAYRAGHTLAVDRPSFPHRNPGGENLSSSQNPHEFQPAGIARHFNQFKHFALGHVSSSLVDPSLLHSADIPVVAPPDHTAYSSAVAWTCVLVDGSFLRCKAQVHVDDETLELYVEETRIERRDNAKYLDVVQFGDDALGRENDQDP